MELRKVLVNIKNNSSIVKWFWFKGLERRRKRNLKIGDEEFLKRAYEVTVGKKLNLENPETYYEKLNWLKLHYRNPLMTVVADKFAVREYLKNLGHGKLLNDIYGYWRNVKDFNPRVLPTQFVLKTTHGSGTAWNLIVTDKSKINWFLFRFVQRQWLKQKIDWMGREWHYSDIPQGFIAEKFLKDETGELRDYKIHCFNGKPKIVSVFTGRFTGHKCEYVHDLNWNLLPFTREAINAPEGFRIDKPENFDRMIEIAAELSEPFPMVRIDFYSVIGRTYFGEFTFYDGSALNDDYTDEAQRLMGSWLILPEANN